MEGASRGIVQEVLTIDNYERWKVLMENYLRGKGLWDYVGVGRYDFDLSKFRHSMRNAEALHIIQLSCGTKIFDKIKDLKTAREAWNFLKPSYGYELKAELDIEQGVVADNHRCYRKLCSYVEKGNSEGAESFITGERGALFSVSNSDKITLLHTAAMEGRVKVIEVLVRAGGESLLKMKDRSGFTALALAAHLTENEDAVKCMVEDNSGVIRWNLLAIKNNDGHIPLLLAARKGHKPTTRYLFEKTPEKVLNELDYSTRVKLLERCIKREIFDVALRLLQSYLDVDQLPPESFADCCGALSELAKMPSAFFSGCRYGFLQKFIYKRILRVHMKFQNSEGRRQMTNFPGRFCGSVLKFLLLPIKLLGIWKIYQQKRTHSEVEQILWYMQRSVEKFNESQLEEASVYEAMLNAAKHGIVEFILNMNDANRDLLWTKDSHNRGIFSYAILNRKQDVFQQINKLNGRRDIIKYRKDVFGNNLLHLAAYLGPSSELKHTAGAALQMQREIQWFKAVEIIVPLKCKEEENDERKKPRDLFTETHDELAKEGEKWAKQAAKSYALVGILITTVMFAAAFTVPGGNNQETGVPIFLNDTVFTTFLMADAISLFTSCTSVLIFIWILTSRFDEKHFLIFLPVKLFSALFFLFLSVASMMIAFCGAFSVELENYWAYNSLFIGGTILGSFPVIVLLSSLLKLIYQIFQSTAVSNPIPLRLRWKIYFSKF